MTTADFRMHVLKRLPALLQKFDEHMEKQPWPDRVKWKTAKPFVNLALPKLEEALYNEPENVYKWLHEVSSELAECVKAWEVPDGNNASVVLENVSKSSK